MKCYVWSMALYGAETWTLRATDQKCLESFKKLLDDLKDRRGYCQLEEEALDRTMWRNRFGRGFGPVV